MTCAYGSLNSAEPCGEPSTHAFTWPGQPRSQLCAKHLRKLSLSSLPHLLAIEPLGPGAVTLPELVALEHDELDELDEHEVPAVLEPSRGRGR